PRRDVGIEPHVSLCERVVDRRERLAEHQLHRDELLLAITTNLEGARDVWMDEPRDELSLFEKHFEQAIVPAHVMTHDLQRDDRWGVRLEIHRNATTEINRAHTSASDLRDHFPMPQACRTERARCPRRRMRHGFCSHCAITSEAPATKKTGGLISP